MHIGCGVLWPAKFTWEVIFSCASHVLQVFFEKLLCDLLRMKTLSHCECMAFLQMCPKLSHYKSAHGECWIPVNKSSEICTNIWWNRVSKASSSKRSAKCEKQAPANCRDLTLVDALDTSQNFRSETGWLCLAMLSYQKQKLFHASCCNIFFLMETKSSWSNQFSHAFLQLRCQWRWPTTPAETWNPHLVCKSWWIEWMNHDEPFDSDIKKHLSTDSCCMNFVLHWDSKYIVCNTWYRIITYEVWITISMNKSSWINIYHQYP